MFRKLFLPPVADLLAFEAAARHASISRAAEELHLTQSAVSRQVRQLEAQLGQALFTRVRQRVVQFPEISPLSNSKPDITAAANALGGKYLTDCTLYVTVEPCVMCAGAIAWSQMGKLVFGAVDEKRGYRRYAPQALHPKTEVVTGVKAEECAQLMKDFFKKKR